MEDHKICKLLKDSTVSSFVFCYDNVNLMQYSDNQSMTTESLQNYYRDEINNDANENVDNRINNSKTITIQSFEYKRK